MSTIQDYSTKILPDSQINYNGNYQTKSYLKHSKANDFFEYLYSYPPKFTLKWDSVDELTQDLLLENNYGVLEHSFPFIDFVEDLVFRGNTQEATIHDYSLKEFVDGYLNKLFTSNFYNKKTKTIQNALSHVPVFAVLNCQNEIVLSKSINFSRSQGPKNNLTQTLYNYSNSVDPLVESYPKLGFFFLNRLDAETYLQEVAKIDIDGTKTVGLSIHCVGLHSAYRITREHHPGIDFRFVPNYQEIKNLLKNNISKANLIVDDEQQQLRFRPRSANLLPFLGKAGSWIIPTRSFLQKNEYFKGVPVYIVQIKNDKRQLLAEQYFNTVNVLDSIWGRFVQFYDRSVGFGHNWIMQGSLKDGAMSTKYVNYVFFNESEAAQFVNNQGRKVARYSGSRTSNIELMVRKPKIFVYNLEDFLESWEEKILLDLNGKTLKTIFDAENTFFIPTKDKSADFSTTFTNKKSLLRKVNQTVDLKYRLFKRYLGFFFSVGYN
jgi:hypothetical protein